MCLGDTCILTHTCLHCFIIIWQSLMESKLLNYGCFQFGAITQGTWYPHCTSLLVPHMVTRSGLEMICPRTWPPCCAFSKKRTYCTTQDFTGGTVDKNPPASAGDTGSFDPWSGKIPHSATATVPML